jgi:hypothetical protein
MPTRAALRNLALLTLISLAADVIPAQGMNPAAEPASVRGEQRRAGRNPSRPFELRAKNADAALQSLAMGWLCLALRALPAHFSRSNAGAK